MATTPPPQPGWYDDPEHRGQRRWWDGVAWTEHRSAASETTRAASEATRAASETAKAPSATSVAYSSAGLAPMRPEPAAQAVPELASAGDRLLAVIVDGLVGFALIIGVSIIAGIFGAMSETVGSLLSVTGMVGYWVVLFISLVMGEGRLGQSYGKHLLGVKVVALRSGQPIGSPAAFGRYVVRVIGVYVLLLGVLWIVWDPQRQGWHDKAVGSVVVKEPHSAKLNPVAYLRTIFATPPA